MPGPSAASPRRLQVKICGITNAVDAQAAVAAGANALGFNCYAKSKRWVNLRLAGEWIAELPHEIDRIAVLVDPTWEEAVAIARLPFVSGLQLHGRETADFCGRLAGEGIRFIKALPATVAEVLQDAPSFGTDTIVLDSTAGSEFGGTGVTFPWRIATEFVVQHPNLRVLLAGGLTPDNVRRAVEIVRPFGVDVTSGVEALPGRKDHRALQRFIAAAQSA